MGAWIETQLNSRANLITHESHPVRVRGLKHFPLAEHNAVGEVAPRVGAWIETILCIVGAAPL